MGNCNLGHYNGLNYQHTRLSKGMMLMKTRFRIKKQRREVNEGV